MTEWSIGLCLSGGGFRAALYSLGVLRYLAEARILRDVQVVCGVSGGSVAAASVISAVARRGSDALDDAYMTSVFDPFVDAVAGRNVRNTAARRWALRRPLPRSRPLNLVVAETLRPELFPELSDLRDLPRAPQLVITATDLMRGRAFRFSRDFIGSWDFDYAPPPPGLAAATAVAASAAAPPWLPPLQLRTEGIGLREAPPVMTVTDGGVYDNLGLEWFQGWASGRPSAAVAADELVVVNASGALQRKDRPLRGPFALNRMRAVQYSQTQATRVRWLVGELEAGRQRGIYLGITADPRYYQLPLPTCAKIDPDHYAGALPSSVVRQLRRVRTDFNSFTRTESELLAYHGYWSAHARYASLQPERAVHTPEWQQFAGMNETQAERLARELAKVRHRIGLGPQLR
ncbi:MAG: patatin-like phospholipase family protein [Solirubrobacteraceae bacterium]